MDSMIANAWHGLMQTHAGKVVVLERGAIRAVGHTLQEVLHYISRQSTVIQIPADRDHHITARDLLGIGWDLLQEAAPVVEREVQQWIEDAPPPPPPPPVEPPGPEAEAHVAIGALDSETHRAFRSVMQREGAELVDRALHIWRLPDGHTYSLLDFARGRPLPESPPEEEDGSEIATLRRQYAARGERVELLERQLADATSERPAFTQARVPPGAVGPIATPMPPVVPAKALDTQPPESEPKPRRSHKRKPKDPARDDDTDEEAVPPLESLGPDDVPPASPAPETAEPSRTAPVVAVDGSEGGQQG